MEKFSPDGLFTINTNIRIERAQGKKAVLSVTSDYCQAILTAVRSAITPETASKLHIKAWEHSENTVVSSPREWLEAACETAILPYNALGDLDLEHPCAFEGFVPDGTFIDQLEDELRNLYRPDYNICVLHSYSCFAALLRNRPRSFTADEPADMSHAPRPLDETDDPELVFGFQGSSQDHNNDHLDQTTVLMRQHIFKPEASRLFVCAYSRAPIHRFDFTDLINVNL